MSRKKILVVEDEAFIAMDIKQILDKEGYDTVIDCFTVDMAVKLVEVHQPDLVLIDVNLNGRKNGLDFARYLRSKDSIPFIFITSFSDRDTLNSAAELFPSAFLTKPFKPIDLVSAIFLGLKIKQKAANPREFSSSVPFAIKQVLEYIDKNIREKLDLETLAKITGWDTEYFGKVFKESVGMTPYQYILKCKIELAKKLLSRPEEFSQSICYEIGFSTYSNFYTAFKKHTQLSPQEYKKLIA
jgi:YesN/AraC family two-component response regulator